MDEQVILGIDPAATKVSFVAITDIDFFVQHHKRLGKSGGEACNSAWHVTNSLLFDINQVWPGATIFPFIESPVVGRGGVRSTMVQCFTSGAIQAALHNAGLDTQGANVSSWKKVVTGRGNSTKPEVAKHLRLRWPALYRAAGGNQDIVDAACIALYGQSILSE
jgi:hypothetical protein